MSSNNKAAATYGQVAEPHEFHWNSDIPGTGTCTCGRPLAHPLHKRSEPTGEHVWDKIAEDDLYQDFADDVPGRRGWTPTKGELALAMGIVVFIVVIFAFIVVAY